jgi:hypothetical protein
VRFIAIDFDGVLHAQRRYSWPIKGFDATLVKLALERGFAVQIMTANDNLAGIAKALNSQGIKTYIDYEMDYRDWDGGKDGKTVIISQRKMWVSAIIDDRAFTFRYGNDPATVLDMVEASALGKLHWTGTRWVWAEESA